MRRGVIPFSINWRVERHLIILLICNEVKEG